MKEGAWYFESERWWGLGAQDDTFDVEQAKDVGWLLSANALHRQSELAPVPPGLQSVPKRFQLQARAPPVLAAPPADALSATRTWAFGEVCTLMREGALS